MSVFRPDPNYSALVDRNSQVKTVAIGLLAESEFDQARASIADLADHRNYEDWLDSREGLQIGLSMAGVDATIVCVSLSSFLEWRGLTGASSDERALDAFAALALIVRNSRASKALAVVSEFDFATHSLDVAAFAGGRDYQDWARHRGRCGRRRSRPACASRNCRFASAVSSIGARACGKSRPRRRSTATRSSCSNI